MQQLHNEFVLGLLLIQSPQQQQGQQNQFMPQKQNVPQLHQQQHQSFPQRQKHQTDMLQQFLQHERLQQAQRNHFVLQLLQQQHQQNQPFCQKITSGVDGTGSALVAAACSWRQGCVSDADDEDDVNHVSTEETKLVEDR
ncbi:uncharacterized protein PG986_008756 [Apiospora aurea]|uniref:Uncharacterized protein n=1 Tax=Apiospora aurea TaxID=335848 RepID=A0ABR1Q5R9_9PEZI